MKRKNILTILLFIMAIVVLPKKVFAADCDLATQAQDGNYIIPAGSTCTITEDIEISQPFMISEGTVTIGLDHNITSTSTSVFQIEGNANVNFSGNGKATITSERGSVINFMSTGDLTISSGTYEGAYPVTISSKDNTPNEGHILIEDGTFTGVNDAVRVLANVKNLSINGGTFTSTTVSGLSVFNIVEQLIINDGTFTGKYHGANIHSTKKLRINGGTFTGEKYGVLLGFNENQVENSFTNLETSGVLLGGTFKSTGDNSNAIGVISVVGDNDIFNTLVGKDHHYSEKFNVIRKDVEGIGSAGPGAQPVETPENEKMYTYASDIKSVSVVEGAPTADQKIEPVKINEDKQQTKEEAKVANPKTGSALYLYVIAFMLVSGLAVFGTYKYHKKLNK